MKTLKSVKLAALILAAAGILGGQESWWMSQPLRWLQTNFRETEAAADPRRMVDQAAAFQANVMHIGMGGIAAYYPTDVPFHERSRYLPAERDTFGETLRLAHEKGMRVIGRFDFSKGWKPAYDAHPEWFFRRANGEPVVYQGLYSACINGGYYRDFAMRVLTEALERYPVDGLFFNMFGNQNRDYSGNFIGHCHCDSCKQKFQKMFGRNLPAEPDDDYRRFMFVSSREVAAEFKALIRRKRPQAGFFTYVQEHTDGIMSESNTAIGRALPLWPYTSSDHVNRAVNSQPAKAAVNLCMQFVDYAWRFATVPPAEIQTRIWQNVAHGGAAAFSVNGTLDQRDRQAVEAARPVFQWLAANESHFRNQQSAARVLLLGAPAATGRTYSSSSYRGLFRLLSEEHIPFAVADNLDWLGKREFDLVIATDWAPADLRRYVENGGRLIVVSPHAPDLGLGKITKNHKDVPGYVRVRDTARFPSLRLTDLLMLNGEFAEVEAPSGAALTLVPPSIFGPPEKIHTDMKDTNTAALVEGPMGKGRWVWLPWDVGGLYYRLSLPAHAGLLRDLIGEALPRRQLTTDAHPLVEISLMRQGAATQLHLVNLSGHSQTAWFPPLPTGPLTIRLEGSFRKARALRLKEDLPLESRGAYVELKLPRLIDYELIRLE